MLLLHTRLVILLLLPTLAKAEVVHVRYGYFPEARPIHAACGRGWFDYWKGSTEYRVTCYPQTSGNFAASRLDNYQLDIANLGSTPLAQAVARGLDLKVVYLSHYMGESQGIYAREWVKNPFDLKGRIVGVPFGSTMHYQVLYVLDLFGLSGDVKLLDLAPSEIIQAWDEGRIDAGACWGIARDHLLKNDGQGDPNSPAAKTLLSAGVMGDWGRPTFVAVAANREFLEEHNSYMTYFVGILLKINDSFMDRLGEVDDANVNRWNAQQEASISYIPSMVDALMNSDQSARNPTQAYKNLQRRALDLFVQLDGKEQASCEYFGKGNCDKENQLHTAILKTAEFLLDQKVIGRLQCSEDLVCHGDFLLGDFLLESQSISCSNCIQVGPYRNELAGPNTLLSRLESLDSAWSKTGFAEYEIGRNGGDSTCTGHVVFDGPTRSSSFNDGAGASPGKSYSENLDCTWEIRADDCFTSNDLCQDLVSVELTSARIWSGDFIRIYTDLDNNCTPDSDKKILLAQVSGDYSNGDFPPVTAKGCLLVQFLTDPNQERSYGGVDNGGDGFEALYNRDADSMETITGCEGTSWGKECTFLEHCIGTTRMFLSATESKPFSSSGWLRREDFFDIDSPPPFLSPYPNDLDCIFEFQVSKSQKWVLVEMFYDLESTHDLLLLQTGSPSSEFGLKPYAVLTGRHNSSVGEKYYIPTDESGIASVELTTDAQGRRLGFFAQARAVDDSEVDFNSDTACEVGYSGAFCEFPYCISSNKLQQAAKPKGLSNSYVLGRVKSQSEGWYVRPMPWSSDSGGCVWPLVSGTMKSGVVSIRLVFNSLFDLEPYPVLAAGDKLIIRTDINDTEFFMEQCESDETCSFPWQTGVCSPNHACIVRDAVEASVVGATSVSAILVTDRNDGFNQYTGLDFDALLVKECPHKRHCEAAGGECVSGRCICSGGIPCSCSCEGDPPGFIGSVKTGLVVGIVLPLFLVFIAFFVWYRRRKILKSRAQKDVINEKEAELEAFRNSVVGMRTATKDYIPRVACVPPEMPKTLLSVPVPPQPPRVQWCWQETAHLISNHSPDAIVGDPADGWIKYDNDSNAKMEAAFQKRNKKKTKSSFSPMPGYVADFNTMVQTKTATGFQRGVQRLVESSPVLPKQEQKVDRDLTSAQMGELLPEDLSGEPQMVLVTGDIIQISTQRNDGWAFGTKLHHKDEAFSRQLVQMAMGTNGVEIDDANVFTDTGWFQLDATQVPSGEDLAVLQTNVGDTGSLDPPTYWEPVVDPTVVKLHRLKAGSDEYDSVTTAFMSTLQAPKFNKKAKIIKVERIQNLAMWQSYVVKRQTICYRETGLQSGDTTANAATIQRKALERFERRWLWHGTNIEVMDKIMQQGFNRSFCGKNATVYGKGVYFARDTSYSAYPTYSVPDKDGFQYIMACRVVVGEYCQGKSNALTPEIRDQATQSLYDTTVGFLSGDTMANPSIYVTYHDAQAYPEYLIKFKLKD